MTGFGVHPAYKKSLTSQSPVEDMPAPDVLTILLQQHIGAPCEELVKPGDKVKAYQKIADSKAFVSAPIHSPVGGTVKSIGCAATPMGGSCRAITIDKEKDAKPRKRKYRFDNKEPAELVKKIREAGLVGLGGAMFPTHVKLSPPPEKPIDTLIINAAECEPYLTADHRIMLECPEEIGVGVEILKRILGVENAYVAVEDNKPECIGEMIKHVDADVVSIETKYPQGAEKTQIETITWRTVPSGGLPMDVGCVVQNVSTVKAIYDAVVVNTPLVERVATVSGDAVAHPKNLKIKIGTRFADIFDYCGGLEGEKKVISGGPMMGVAQYNLDAPSVKGTSGLLAFTHADEAAQTACIRCARCIDACPMNLMPNTLYKLVDDSRVQGALENGLMDCVECGCCSYTCPSKINHVHYMKLGKLKARKIKAKREAEGR